MFSAQNLINLTRSPSVWREWIEIVCGDYVRTQLPVSLRVEGVD